MFNYHMEIEMKAHRKYAVVLAALLVYGCSESSSPSNPTVEFYAQLTSSSVRQSMQRSKGTAAAGFSIIDSIKIDRVRILARRLKLHSSDNDSVGKDIKTDALIFTFTPTQQWVTSATIPPNTYRWVKFEFHRLSSDEAQRYLQDTTFADFIPPERYSVIIDGKVYAVGDTVPTPFTYRSQVTANAALKFDPPIEVSGGTLLGIVVRFDPQQAFVKGNVVLDPRDPANRSEIEGNIRNALKALKRQ